MKRTKIKPSHPDYPSLVCWECGVAARGGKGRIATFFAGVCGICGETKSVTQPRDFAYPTFDVAQKSPTALQQNAAPDALRARSSRSGRG